MIYFLQIISYFTLYALLTIIQSSNIFTNYKKPNSSVVSFPSTIHDATIIEDSIGSKDVSYKYVIKIDKSLYPNQSNFDLAKVKRFARPDSDRGIAYTVEYFATLDDSIRAIVHEWNVSESGNKLENLFNSDLPKADIIKIYNRKFNSLDSTFTTSLGKPFIKKIAKNSLKNTKRDDIKWISQTNLNVYLIIFKRDINTYRQIRAVVYLK